MSAATEIRPAAGDAAELVKVKLHVHRVDLHNAERPRKWWVHLGDQRAAFVDCVITAPMRTVIDLERGDQQPEPCAQAWLEAEVAIEDIAYSDDGLIVYIGPRGAA